MFWYKQKWRVSTALLTVAGAMLMTTPSVGGNTLDIGRELARKHCAVCHVVGDYNKFGGIGSTPSFQLLASMKDGVERFQTFYARHPHLSFVSLPGQKPPTDLPLNAPGVTLTIEQIEAIVAYGLTLKDPRLAN